MRDDWLCVDAHGLRLGIYGNDSALLQQVPDRLPAGWKWGDAFRIDRHYSVEKLDRATYLLYQDGVPLARVAGSAAALAWLEYEIELHVAEWSPARVFVHAGVVAWAGQALVIPGRSFSGKSTLVAALCAAGATYYSDEFALLDERGWVHPYPRRLNLRREVPGVCRRDTLSLGAADLPPLPVGIVVMTGYEEGARWSPRQISLGEAFLGLLGNTMCAQSRPQAAFGVLRRALQNARALVGPRGEAAETAQRLLEIAGQAGA